MYVVKRDGKKRASDVRQNHGKSKKNVLRS